LADLGYAVEIKPLASHGISMSNRDRGTAGSLRHGLSQIELRAASMPDARDITGGGFGLTYNARNATDTRSELGSRFDEQIILNWNAVLALRGRHLRTSV
jgi:hypothetical protein